MISMAGNDFTLAKPIAKFIMNIPTLQYIHFYNNNIQPEELSKLYDILLNSELVNIHLQSIPHKLQFGSRFLRITVPDHYLIHHISNDLIIKMNDQIQRLAK